ncbi:MAG: AtpZ/AtpI family protein [Holophagaceae bacterium]|nr:AtpZ/AtpI family protein [Holophagaceae bacterium]
MPMLKPEGGTPQERALWGDLIGLGMVFPIAICLGYFIGRYIGGYFGHAYGGGLWGLGWGIATGFYELYKVTMRLSKAKPPEGSAKDAREDEEHHEP